MGAGGRDFHTVNTLYRNDPSHEVVAFTAAQIPGIAGRRYPPGLAGPLYPRTASRSTTRASSRPSSVTPPSSASSSPPAMARMSR